jgi:hypothetical chaperone protein
MKPTSHFCGLDFGTSNSTIGIYIDKQCQLIPLENNKISIRSAIFYDTELQELSFGQTGIDAYLNGIPGRLMMSLKSVLGSSLMQDKTVIFNKFVPYTEILGQFIQHLKQQAEHYLNNEITQVVLGRPVRFHDDDDNKDQLAQNTLENIARQLGFKEIAFQYEPIAAALAYEQTIDNEQLALIIDMGGGTSDFTVIRLSPTNKNSNRTQDVLSNHGIHLGGTDFDRNLSLQSVMPLLGMGSLVRGSSSDIQVPNSFYFDLTTWHTLNYLYTTQTLNQIRTIYSTAHDKRLLKRLLHVLQHKQGHRILNSIELSKQQLSEVNETLLHLNFIEESLSAKVSRAEFNAAIANHIDDISKTIQQTVHMANVKFADIDAVFYTGGSTKIPIIREKINALLPQAKIIQGDAFGSVGLGLTLDAARRFNQI